MRDLNRIFLFMILSVDQLMVLADAFCTARGGLSRSRLSTLLFNDGKRLDRLAEGGDLGTRQSKKAVDWLSDNWPDGADWPEGVARPGDEAPPASPNPQGEAAGEVPA